MPMTCLVASMQFAGQYAAELLTSAAAPMPPRLKEVKRDWLRPSEADCKPGLWDNSKVDVGEFRGGIGILAKPPPS